MKNKIDLQGNELVKCDLNCEGINCEPNNGFPPRCFCFEKGSGNHGAMVIGINPGKADKKEEEGRLVEGLVEGLVESQKKILKLAKENPYISIAELSKKIGISTTAIDKNIAKLKEKGILKRIGPDKGGYWEIKKEDG